MKRSRFLILASIIMAVFLSFFHSSPAFAQKRSIKYTITIGDDGKVATIETLAKDGEQFRYIVYLKKVEGKKTSLEVETIHLQREHKDVQRHCIPYRQIWGGKGKGCFFLQVGDQLPKQLIADLEKKLWLTLFIKP